MSERPDCWCGNTDLLPFSAEYLRCPVCDTLVLAKRPDAPLGHVRDDEHDFYGRRYWFDHQEQDLGLSNLVARVRQDLPERCLHWLRTLLAYKAPPATSLELGSSHGGFVALLRWAGFDASGLELSPWVADFARRSFDLPMFVGPIETQAIEPGSLDVIVAMDVVEHLEAPLATLRHCVSLLRPDGVLLLQTPCYPAGMTYEALVEMQSPFLAQLQAPEHVFLLSERAMRELLRRVGVEHVSLEPAIFAHYDMFLAASPLSLQPVDAKIVEERLATSASGRMVQALLDLHADRAIMQRDLAAESAHVRWLKQAIEELERDRAARLTVLEEQGARLGQIPTLEADISHLKAQVSAAEEDRAARLALIERQGSELGRMGALEADITHLKAQVDAAEEDRAARLALIERQGSDLGRIGALEADIVYLKQQIETIEADRAARLAIIELQRDELARIPQLNARLTELTEHATRVDADLISKDEIVRDQQRELTRLSSLVESHTADEQRMIAVREELVRWQLRCADLERKIAFVSRSRVLRLLRRVGFFR